MSIPIISIVIPTFNQGKYISECLESIKLQSFLNFEVLIQDSESTDETQDICKNYALSDARFKYFREKDKGQSDAINRGLQKSKGIYWTWICSDDCYNDSDALSALYHAMEDSELCVGVFGEAIYINEDSSELAKYFSVKKDVYRSTFKTVWPFSQPASLLKMDLVKKEGGVDQKLHLGMDLDLFLNLLKSENSYFKHIQNTIAKVRVHQDSKTIALAKKTMCCALRLQIKHFGLFFNFTKSIYLKTYLDLLKNDLKNILKRFLNRF